VDTVHLAIASHNHADHIGGMARVLETIPVRNYMENGMVATTRTYARIVTLLEERGIPVLRAEPRRIDIGGGAVLRVLASSPEPRSQNDASIGLELSYGSFRALFTGDAEERQRAFWARDSGGKAQVLKVSHHGSVNGTDTQLLQKTRPCAAIISVGARNSFGHPSRRVSRLLDSASVATWRTDRSGHVTVVVDSSGGFTVTGGRPTRQTTFRPAC
jgi:beta-lactamase superfamily II metal-dependent hydrolase